MTADNSMTMRDMSRTRKSEQALKRKQRQRENEKELGCRVITIRLDPDEAELFARLRHKQRGPLADFPRRALITGAMFTANSGTPRGMKERKNRGSAEVEALLWILAVVALAWAILHVVIPFAIGGYAG